MPSCNGIVMGSKTAALVNVYEIQANCLVADTNLARAGIAHGDLYQLELFGASMLIYANGSGLVLAHAGLPSFLDVHRARQGRHGAMKCCCASNARLCPWYSSPITQRLTPTAAVLLIIPPMLWAGNAVVGRVVSPLISPMTLNLLRWALAFLLLLPFAYRTPRDSPLWSQWRRFAFLALLSTSGYNALLYLALNTSTPINVTLVEPVHRCGCS